MRGESQKRMQKEMKGAQPAQCQVVVLISGNGSNLQALIDAAVTASFNISAVISNNPDAYGLQRAGRANIPAVVVNHRAFASREQFDLAMMQAIDSIGPDLIVLAGFMRILGGKFVSHYQGRILNIHPSLLPKYPGLNTHQRALDAGDKEHGASIHFVTDDLDGGPVVTGERVAVLDSDDAESLAARVLEKEHIIYPRVVSWYADGRLRMARGKAVLDNQVLLPGGAKIQP